MSHVAFVECQVSDLDALEKALTALSKDAKLARGQRQFEYYAGAKSPCLHAIKVPGTRYEIGLVQAKAEDDKTFKFACDFFDRTLSRTFGQNLVGLQNEYLAVVAEDKLAAQGWMTRRDVAADGTITVTANQW